MTYLSRKKLLKIIFLNYDHHYNKYPITIRSKMHLQLIIISLIYTSYGQVTYIPTISTPPAARNGNSIVYSAQFNLLLTFGGSNNGNYFNDL